MRLGHIAIDRLERVGWRAVDALAGGGGGVMGGGGEMSREETLEDWICSERPRKGLG